MVYIVAYMQLKQQLQRVLGKDIRCIVMDYSLEEGSEISSLTFPDLENVTMVYGTDIRSKLLLLTLAYNSPNPINVIELKGEYTSISPLAVSDSELSTCCENAYCLNNNLRDELIEEYKNLPDSKYLRIYHDKVSPLFENEIDEFIINQIRKPIDIRCAVGLCMGNAPCGWPISDTFYYKQICRLSKSGSLKVLPLDLLQ